MKNVVPWPTLIRRLRFLTGVNQAEFADQIGVIPSTVTHWESGSMVPQRRLQKIIRDQLVTLEPAIHATAIESMPVIAMVHSNSNLPLCCVGSQVYADSFEMRADELRYFMVHSLWTANIEECAEAVMTHPVWRAGEAAYAHVTFQRQDGQWVRYAGTPIGAQDKALWFGAVIEKPASLQTGEFDLAVTSLDELLLD